MADKTPKVIQITVPNFPVSAKQILESEAERQDRSLASLLRMILIQHAAQLEQATTQPAEAAA